MSHFTPISALVGGSLIGISASVLWLTVGRVAGISAILGAATRAELDWRTTFLTGLVLAPLALAAAGWPLPLHASPPEWLGLALGGVLVGFGSRLGSGCTSGHGVCGIARLSPRSLAATAVFMLVAALVVYIRRHVA